MLVKEVVDILKAKEIYIDDQNIYNKNYDKGFSSDLMSDALALLKNETEDILFITGLANVQSLRTAEVLDIETILFVRGKPLDMSIVDMFDNNYLKRMTSAKQKHPPKAALPCRESF